MADVNTHDMPTIARIRARLAEIPSEDLTIKQLMFVLGVSSTAPIRLRIDRGELSAAKVCGEWMIDRDSINHYLDHLNKNYNKQV